MSYTPTNWNTGDVITAEKLNKLEGGVADKYDLIINATYIETSEDEGITVDTQITTDVHGLSYNELRSLVVTGQHPQVKVAESDKYWDATDDGTIWTSVPLYVELSNTSSENEFLTFTYGASTFNFKLYANGAFNMPSVNGEGTYTYNSGTKTYTFTFDEQ